MSEASPARPSGPTSLPARCYACNTKKLDLPRASLMCPKCVQGKLRSLWEQELHERQLLEQSKEKLNGKLMELERQQRRKERLEMTARVQGLREACSNTRDQIFEGRIDAEDLRYRTQEKQQIITDAWEELKYKQKELVINVLEPLRNRLKEQYQNGLQEVAELRKSKVLQAIKFFQVAVTNNGAEIMGMKLPRYIHSFNRGGSIAECMAITQLGRLTDIIARYLNISLPFALHYKPSHCVIRGGGREGKIELALSPPINALSGTAAASANAALSDEDWMRQYRRALHLLALNVRHLLLTQAEPGTEEEDAYQKICATNDISPIGTLRTLLMVCRQTRLGYGEQRSFEYAFAQEKLFAVAGRQGEITVKHSSSFKNSPHSPKPGGSRPTEAADNGLDASSRTKHPTNPLTMSIDVMGDLEYGDSTDWAIVLPPPPSETPD